MNRRSLDVEGWVNFPIHLSSTGEGGMFVRLWVIDQREFDEQYGVCAGAWISEEQSETFMGSDRGLPHPEFPDVDWASMSPEEARALMDVHDEKLKAWREEFYSEDGHSVPLLCSILMGSTGWSSGDFLCRFDDLTEDGKALYRQMEKLYPKAELHLVTFLDT